MYQPYMHSPYFGTSHYQRAVSSTSTDPFKVSDFLLKVFLLVDKEILTEIFHERNAKVLWHIPVAIQTHTALC